VAGRKNRSKRLGKVAPEDPKQAASSAGLRYVTDAGPGITRKPKGDGFVYYDNEEKQVRNKFTLDRLNSLAIPPAWRNVWICTQPNGHPQATGIDARGRKQYKYHPTWRSVRDEAKFERLLSFGRVLPKIRARVDRDLRLPDLARKKVIATVVRLLEISLIRIGNEAYAKENKSFGLTTMRNRHVAVKGSTVKFQFRGKGGKVHSVEVSDKRIARVVKKCQELPGQKLFEYENSSGAIATIGSEDVNDYLQRVTGQPFTAKDFRTWAGTVFAALALSEFKKYDSQAEAKRNVVAAIEKVARQLGNTPAICRKCYVHPEILNSYMSGELVKMVEGKIAEKFKRQYAKLNSDEVMVLAFLNKRLKSRPA
jgi:DNA topoisomerase I